MHSESVRNESPSRRRIPIRTILVCSIIAIFLMRMFGNQHPPLPATFVYKIVPENVTTAVLTEQLGRSGKPGVMFSPHHINYSSSSGDVEFYIFPFSSTEDDDQVARMMNLVEDLKAGKEITGFSGKTTGHSGRLSFPKDIWKGGMHGILLLMKAEEETELTLSVHYGPENG